MAGGRSLAAASDGSIDWTHSHPEPGMARATYEDVLNAPENKVAEILDGELFLSPRPALPHAASASRLGFDLGGPFDRGRGGPGGWWILYEPELHLGEDVLVPDIAGWRRERMPSIPQVPYFTMAPDWVCEVLSPSTERIDRAKKLRIYAAAGVAHAWLLDPLQRTLEVLRLHEGTWTIVSVLAGSEMVRAEPFAAVELDLGGLWLEPPATTSAP